MANLAKILQDQGKLEEAECIEWEGFQREKEAVMKVISTDIGIDGNGNGAR